MRRLEQVVHPPLDLAREQTDAQPLRLAQIGRQLGQHRQATADVKAADGDLHAGGAQLAGDVDGARKLVGLHADQAHQAVAAVALETRDGLAQRQAGGGLITDSDLDVDGSAEHLALRGILSEPIDAR